MKQEDVEKLSPALQKAIAPIPPEQEDPIFAFRIANDERPLRRVVKKFQNYVVLSQPLVPLLPTPPQAIEDAREAFLVELRTYQLSMKKSAMICEAETRQVEEYHRERKRIDEEYATLRRQIEELKVALEHAQMLRKRKIEYDAVTEKVNSLPPRDELEMSISSLESDMAAIRVEQDLQTRILLNQQTSLNGIISDLQGLRFIGKEKEPVTAPNSARATPAPDSLETLDILSATAGAPSEAPSPTEKTSMKDSEREEGEEEEGSLSAKLDASVAAEDDIEMGEVEEDPRDSPRKKVRDLDEELEEGEASDLSSVLSDPPDD